MNNSRKLSKRQVALCSLSVAAAILTWTYTPKWLGGSSYDAPVLTVMDAMCPGGRRGGLSDVREYNIPAMANGFEALKCFERQAGFAGIVWDWGSQSMFTSPAIKGRMSASDALNKLLASSVYSFEVPDGMNVIFIISRNHISPDASTQELDQERPQSEAPKSGSTPTIL